MFAYLRGEHPQTENGIALLGRLGWPALVVAPWIPAEFRRRHAYPNVLYSAELFAMEAVAKTCDLGIAHGGIGTVANFLLAGKPLLLLPMHLEQYLLSRNVGVLGAGLLIPPEQERPDLRHALARLVEEPAFAASAGRFAACYGGEDRNAIAERILERCEAILAAG